MVSSRRVTMGSVGQHDIQTTWIAPRTFPNERESFVSDGPEHVHVSCTERWWKAVPGLSRTPAESVVSG